MLAVVKVMGTGGGCTCGGGGPRDSTSTSCCLRAGASFSGRGSRRRRRSRLGSLPLPLALPLSRASLGIAVRQVTVARAVRAHHGKLHFCTSALASGSASRPLPSLNHQNHQNHQQRQQRWRDLRRRSCRWKRRSSRRPSSNQWAGGRGPGGTLITGPRVRCAVREATHIIAKSLPPCRQRKGLRSFMTSSPKCNHRLSTQSVQTCVDPPYIAPQDVLVQHSIPARRQPPASSRLLRPPVPIRWFGPPSPRLASETSRVDAPRSLRGCHVTPIMENRRWPCAFLS